MHITDDAVSAPSGSEQMKRWAKSGNYIGRMLVPAVTLLDILSGFEPFDFVNIDTEADAIIKAEAPKRIVMQFVHDASKSQLADAFDESFNNNTPDARKTVKADIERLLGALEPVKDGDQMVFTYVPGKGTTFAINGKEKLTIAAPAFGPVLLSVWLGPKPPNADLKKGMLGQ